MSLINEALKRAKQAQARRVAAIATEPALEPAVAPAANPSPPAWLTPVGVGLVLVVAFWFLFLWWRTSQREAARAQSRPDDGQQIAQVMSAVVELTQNHPNKPAAPQPKPSFLPSSDVGHGFAMPPPSAPSSSTPQSAGADPVHTPAVTAPAVPETVPVQLSPLPSVRAEPEREFKLQGIFYRASQASALINGQTLFVGDEIGGARLVRIERRAVHLLQKGQTNVLTLH
jgi:hypothetical protein